MKKSVYHVPVENLDRLRDKLAKLNRRASRNGVAPIAWGEVGRFTKKKADYSRLDDLGRPWMRDIDYAHVVVENRVVKVAGWTFTATLEHAGEAGNILRRVPGAPGDIPTTYRDADPWCDHCRTRRRRNDTYLLLSDDGEWKQVGSNCLSDFLGTSPTYAAAMAEYLLSVKTAMGEDDFSGGGSRGYPGIDAKHFLAFVHRSINTSGWVSKGKAKTDFYGELRATADIAETMYINWRDKTRDRTTGKLYETAPTDEELAVAGEALEWARALEGELDDYLHNLKVATAGSTMTWRSAGLVASVIPAMNRAKEREIKRAEYRKRAAASEYIGEVGKPLTFTGTVVMLKELDGVYGVTYLTKFVEGDGNTVVWFASRPLDRGVTYRLTATVKAHRDYNGAKETVITRGRGIDVVKEESNGEAA